MSSILTVKWQVRIDSAHKGTFPGSLLENATVNLFADELVPLLVRVLESITEMKWIDDGLVNKHDNIPIQEQFSFCFNTVLSDIAARFPQQRDRIVSAQVGRQFTLAFLSNCTLSVGQPFVCSDDHREHPQ